MAAVPAFHFGLSGLVLLLMLGSHSGIPVGIPPATEDPLLARVASDECLYYTTWSGMAQPQPGSSNHTERLLAEPEIQRLVREWETRLRQSLRRKTATAADDRMAMLGRTLPDLAKLVLTHAGAICVSTVEVRAEGLHVDAAAVLHVADQAATSKRLLQELAGLLPPEIQQRQQIGGSEYIQLKLAPNLPPVTWGIRDNYLILATGEQAVANLLQRMAKEPPAWLAELRQRFPVERRSTLTYANLRQIIALGIRLAGDPKLQSAVDAMGLSNVVGYEATTGLDATGFVSRSAVRLDGLPQSFFSLLKGEPLSLQHLKGIPADATVAIALRLDARKLLDIVTETVGSVEPRAAEELSRGLDELKEQLGLDLRNDLLQALGDVWHLSTSPGDGGLALGWTAAVQVRDTRRLNATLNRLLGFAQASLARRERSPQIRNSQHAGHDIYFLEVPDDDFPFAPAWCLAEDQLLVALFPQAIVARLSRGADETSLADQPDVAALFRGDTAPVWMAYADTRPIFELIYPFLQLAVRVGFAQLQNEGIDLDISLMPSTGCVARHLQPSLFAVRSTADGIEALTQQTLPGSSVGATAPLSAALLLPAVQGSREAARRMQSLNNLKQIGLAMHNFHDVYKAFPAACSSDIDGKPLLSWRVHILPFIEQNALYERFHFDEPWDSEHNKKLIAQMPPSYRSPNSAAEPGKTVYLGIRHEDAVLVPPAGSQQGQQPPAGTRMAQIVDGTSNTILVVEANDQHAVIWTKPDDLEADLDNVLKDVLGLQRNGFLALFSDGYVRFLPASIDPATLKAAITKKDGKAIRLP